MFVKYSPAHPHIKVVPIVNGDGLSVAAESVTLLPGTNEVSDEKWEKIKASLASEIESGLVKPFSVKTPGQQTAKTLKDVPAAVAAKIIAECSNKNTLREWFRDTLPDEVALLVIKRMRALDMDLDASDEEGEALSFADIVDESKGAALVKSKNRDDGKGDKKEAGNRDNIPDFDNPNVKVK